MLDNVFVQWGIIALSCYLLHDEAKANQRPWLNWVAVCVGIWAIEDTATAALWCWVIFAAYFIVGFWVVSIRKGTHWYP